MMTEKDKEEFHNAVREVAHLCVRLDSPYGKYIFQFKILTLN